MAVEITAALADRLSKEAIIWITTVREDGLPQPTPVWFVWHDDAILILSRPDAKKIRNLRHNPRVALNLNSDAEGGNIVVISGSAHIDSAPLSPDAIAQYYAKYGEGIKGLGMSDAEMAQQFSTHIHITPERIRAE